MEMPTLMKLIPEISEKYKEVLLDFPEYLYHYTDLNGLLGILDVNGFWATNYGFLNDKEEILHGKKLCVDIIGILKEEHEHSGGQKFLDELLNLIFSNDQDVFIVSFCSKPDLLSQWRGYSRGSAGVSLGFKFNELVKYSTIRDNEYFIPRSVIYNPDIQSAILYDCIKAGLEYVLDYPEHEYFIVREINNTVKYFISLFKDSSFKEESEWRFVVTNYMESCGKKHQVKFRTRNNFILPYIEMKLKYLQAEELPLPVRKIIVGPPANDTTIKSIEYMLQNKDLNDISVLPSNIPFR